MTEDVQPMTIRLPKSVHERLRRLAFETRQSMNDIAVAAIDDATRDKEEKP
jgi:predicted transcriptional regulator